MKYTKMREEELKNRVGADFFEKFNCTRIVGSIDFAVKFKRSNNALDFNDEYLLWAEAKVKPDGIPEMLTQLVLTIGKARTFDKIPPPPFLGCFDNTKIAFIRYANFHEIFNLSDFNWNITPSNRETREFKQVEAYINKIIDNSRSHEIYIFDFEKDEKELIQFIRENFVLGKTETTQISINKNNFISVYNKWLEAVKPSIRVDWEFVKKDGIIDGDFYLADLLSDDNKTLKDKLYVLLKHNEYEVNKGIGRSGMLEFMRTDFKDKQKAHTQFWAKYKRPPLEEYWDYIVNRRDLLVPQDVRERKGSFFTPKIWVELSQKYIADVLGEDWQDEYYVWDCAAGTGNLLAGLTNKYNIWASTLDKADVDVMKDRIKNGANLLEDHVFQFDFLNDSFNKLPKGLLDIVNDEKRRKKLVIYINPPYAEVSTRGGSKAGVNQSKIHDKYISKLGTAGRELYTQFIARIYCEIYGCKLAEFSTLKTLQGSAFDNFRSFFHAKLEKMFVVPANTFDNVKGSFPIGFKFWNTNENEKFVQINADVFGHDGSSLGKKGFCAYDKNQYINKWISSFKNNFVEKIGFMDGINGNDFQHNNIVFIVNDKSQLPNPRGIWINQSNLIAVSVYFAVRKSIDPTWLNDRDQFLFPDKGWQKDLEFQNNCLAFTLFNNNISSKFGINYWIPFTENEISSRDNFSTNYMIDFITGKLKQERSEVKQLSIPLEKQQKARKTALKFSVEAKCVFKAGKNLWKYYHAQPDCNVNASLYDIREYFQGRNDKGKMNNKSDDEKYNGLIGDLRLALKVLGEKIVPKVYEYGFLRE